MEVKGVSFSKYKVKVNTYIFEKLDLFAFLFTNIILDENLDKNKKVVECLLDLDIKEDLYYLINNVYYKMIDNGIIKDNYSDDITNLKLKDIVVEKRFQDYLKQGYFPILNGEIEKEFIYDYLLNKVVLEKQIYDDSNVCVLKVDNDKSNIEKIINDNKKSLLDIDQGLCVLTDVIVDPYCFKINTNEVKNKEKIYKSLKENSLFLTDKVLEGEYLSNNVYFECLFSNYNMREYCDYLFINDKEKEFKVEDNIIYVDYAFDCDFLDLKNKESYICGKMLLEDTYISTFIKNKEDVSKFKLYLTKNKNKFTSNINKIIELI